MAVTFNTFVPSANCLGYREFKGRTTRDIYRPKGPRVPVADRPLKASDKKYVAVVLPRNEGKL